MSFATDAARKPETLSGQFERLRRKWHWFIDRFIRPSPARLENPYLTHLPVLVLLAALNPVRRVLELGSGDYSTLTFLNHQCFPDLERLDSYENDATWARNVLHKTGADERLNLKIIDGPIDMAIPAINVDGYDLILVDDSTSAPERSNTIAALAAANPKQPTIVVHDYELLPYRDAAKQFVHRFRFTGLNPNTGVVWNHDRLPRSSLRKLNRLLHREEIKFSPQDPNAWASWVRQQL